MLRGGDVWVSQSKELTLHGTFGQNRVVVLRAQKKDEWNSDVDAMRFSNSTYLWNLLHTYASAKDPDWFLLEEDLKWHPQGVILMNRCRGIRFVLKTDWFCFHSWSFWSTCKKKGNKLSTNWITDCQTISVNHTNEPNIACIHAKKSSPFLKGSAARNQNLTKLTSERD